MRIVFPLLWLYLCCFQTNSFVIRRSNPPKQLRVFETYDSLTVTYNTYIVPFENIKQKLGGIKRLIRANNIIPATLLCTTGGWLANPSLNSLFTSPAFYVSNLVTLFIMSASMAINDIVDYPIDKINNPTRPLITGEVTRAEAIILSATLFISTEILSFLYLPKSLYFILQFAIANALLYTPILKRIPLIKNVACSGMIAFAPIFTGLSVINTNANIELLVILARLVFFGSLQIELLLDICDREGDKINRIRTIPVLFGKEMTLYNIIRVFAINIITITMDISRLFGLKMGLVFAFMYVKNFLDLIRMPEHQFSKNYIKYTIESTVYPFIQSLVYFSVLAFGNRIWIKF
jgi:4-hydroxybenzoate polyprenyltransferase